MWKFFSRGLRESVERGLNLGRTDVRINKETQKTTYARAVPSSLVFCRKLKWNCHHEKNDGANENKQKAATDIYDTWFGAFTFSSALALGWVLSQPCHWKKWFRERCSQEMATPPGPSLVELLASVYAQPTLPSPLNSINNQQGNNELEYGPLTAQQAVEEAAAELGSVHNRVTADVENRRGVELAEGPPRGRPGAPRLFMSALNKGSLPAAYNLAQCYELGIGLKQDYAQAAKWYRWAAEKGHATAMYNLAVFYAHGWGGLDSDTKLARHWLEMAGQKGQPQAREALGLAKVQPPPIATDDLNDWGLSEKETSLQDVSCDPNQLYDLAASYENNPCDDSEVPHLILELYKMASDLGHKEAKSRFKTLQAYETLGLLTDYLCIGKRGTDLSQIPLLNLKIPPPIM